MNQQPEPTRAGDIIEQALTKLTKTIETITPEERERRRQRDEMLADQQHEYKVKDLIAKSRAPRRQLEAIAIDRSGEWGKTERALLAQIGSGFTIALVGVRGSGKTQLGVELIRHRSSEYGTSRYCTAMEFFIDVKAGYKEDGEAEKVILAEFGRPSLLVMDELGRRSENDWENRLLYELLNRRYNEMRDTLLISNQDVSQLEGALGPSLVSRMRETGGVIECNWESYRK